MATTTNKLGLTKPLPNTDRDWGFALNNNFDVLDNVFTSVSGIGTISISDNNQGQLTISGSGVAIDGSTPITGDQEISRLGVGNVVFPGQQLTVHGVGETQVSRFRTANPGYNSWIQLESIDSLELISFIKGSQQKWTIRDDAASNLLISNDQNIPIFTISNGGTSEALRVNASSFVGIGNINPVTPLEVKGRIRIQGAGSGDGLQLTQPVAGVTDLDFLSNVGASQWKFRHDDGNNFILQDSAGANVIGVLQGAGAGGEVIRVDAQGEVGIGTTTPGAKLDVNGTGRFLGQLDANAGLTVFGSPITGLWEQPVHVVAPVAGQEIVLITRSTASINMQVAYAQTSAGSVNYTLRINGTPITGMSNVVADTTTRTTARNGTGEVNVPTTGELTLTFDSVTGGENFSMSLQGVRVG